MTTAAQRLGEEKQKHITSVFILNYIISSIWIERRL